MSWMFVKFHSLYCVIYTNRSDNKITCLHAYQSSVFCCYFSMLQCESKKFEVTSSENKNFSQSRLNHGEKKREINAPQFYRMGWKSYSFLFFFSYYDWVGKLFSHLFQSFPFKSKSRRRTQYTNSSCYYTNFSSQYFLVYAVCTWKWSKKERKTYTQNFLFFHKMNL